MDLNWLKLSGYKRLESATLNTSGKVVAIVGSNEAGKSSILKALLHLNHNGRFLPQELTRGKELQDDNIVLEAGFLLSDNDRAAISDLYRGEQVRQFKIRKFVHGIREYEIIPRLQRDPSPRLQLVNSLKFALENEEFKKHGVSHKNKESQLEDAKNLIPELENTDKILDKNALKKINTLKSVLNLENVSKESEPLSEIINKLLDGLNNLIIQEQETEPNEQAIKVLTQQIPKILFLDDTQRNLESRYDLSKLAASPPPALRNLAALANLNLLALYNAIQNGEQARVNTFLNKANSQIVHVVKDKWSQSSVRVSLTTNQSILYVLMEDEQQECTNLDERSDGLRQFVALINFLEAEHADQQPILLIDEAENHLHYDAQADLMNMFAKQQLASKIIYTTHSAGCLPEDLGNGVRFVSPIGNIERSEIKNWFWQDKRPGFSSLLFGMGASTLAFVPIRKAVFVEGSTDMLLLPTIFRQVTNRRHLGFKITPGLSVAVKSTLSLLENEASTVAFLVDNDSGGKVIIKHLKDAGIDESRIFHLPGNQGLVLEDCIRKELYLEAINNAIQNWNINSPTMNLEELADINRPENVKNWCKNKGIEPPDKRAIAYYLLDFATGERQEFIVKTDLQEPLKLLYEEIAKALNL